LFEYDSRLIAYADKIVKRFECNQNRTKLLIFGHGSLHCDVCEIFVECAKRFEPPENPAQCIRQYPVVGAGPCAYPNNMATTEERATTGGCPYAIQETIIKMALFYFGYTQKIQTEGKWDSVREQVCKFKKTIKNKTTAEIFIDDVQHGYDRELCPILIGHCFWERLKFSTILDDCGFNKRQIKTAQMSLLNRLIAQDSEHSIILWLQTVSVEEIIGLDVSLYGDDRFYRISDKLLKHRDYIEENLYQRTKSKRNGYAQQSRRKIRSRINKLIESNSKWKRK